MMLYLTFVKLYVAPKKHFRNLAILLACVFSSHFAYAQPDDACPSKFSHRQMKHLGRKKVIAEYQRMVQTDCTSRDWQSDYHRILQRLAQKMVGRPKAELIAVMGPPDEVEDDGRIIYHWRGRHDYVFFYEARGKIVKSSWFYAFE